MLAFNHLGKLGQLGNQMFQYSALRGIASKVGSEFMIPNHQEIYDDGIGNRYTILLFDVFKLVHASNFGTLNTSNYVSEEHFHFNEDMFNLENGKDASLWGFFQTQKYFEDIKYSIFDDFTFKDEIVEHCIPLREQFDNPIALHIRRGDFLTNSGNHPPQGLDYYEKALKEFDDDREVIIFSDDTEWCKQQKLFESDRFAVAEGGNQFYDLCLMSMCEDYIIANSSFSWWGAWLANHPVNPPRLTSFKGKVIAPKKWFGPNLDHDTKDLYCPDWVVL